MKKSWIVGLLLGFAAIGAIGFAVNYALGAQTQIASVTLGFSFAMLAAALVVWEHELLPHKESIEAVPSLRSEETQRAEQSTAFAEGTDEYIGRRKWLSRMLAGTVAVIGAALLFPLRSLAPRGPSIADALRRTGWQPGARLVREDGTPVSVHDIEVDSVLTVFPQGRTAAADSREMANTATMLIRVPPEELQLDAERRTWAPDGIIAFSKVCTHAGCPVALYRAASRQLVCPCHQSVFDVLRGAKPVFGPADRALPQLPLRIAADGSIEAISDFTDPIGPAHWESA